jgi:MoxR-like ATPase
MTHFSGMDRIQKPALLKISDLHWRFAVRAVTQNHNLLIRGEAGSGKTMLAHSLRDATRRPFFAFNCGAMTDARSSLIGTTHFSKDRGTFVVPALFAQAIQTPNALILLDEVSRAPHDAPNILMTVLDKRQRYLRMDEHVETPTIHVAEGVSFLGTANVGIQYTGTRTMDRSFLDRWTILMMDVLTEEQEYELLRELYPDSVNPADARRVAQLAAATRTELRSNNPKLDVAISTRMTVEMGALLRDGFSFMETLEVCVLPFYSAQGGAESPQAYVKKMAQQVADTDHFEKMVSGTNLPSQQYRTPWG